MGLIFQLALVLVSTDCYWTVKSITSEEKFKATPDKYSFTLSATITQKPPEKIMLGERLPTHERTMLGEPLPLKWSYFNRDDEKTTLVIFKPNEIKLEGQDVRLELTIKNTQALKVPVRYYHRSPCGICEFSEKHGFVEVEQPKRKIEYSCKPLYPCAKDSNDCENVHKLIGHLCVMERENEKHGVCRPPKLKKVPKWENLFFFKGDLEKGGEISLIRQSGSGEITELGCLHGEDPITYDKFDPDVKTIVGLPIKGKNDKFHCYFLKNLILWLKDNDSNPLTREKWDKAVVTAILKLESYF